MLTFAAHVFFVAIALGAGPETPAPEALVARIQNTAGRHADVTAHFTQTYRDSLRPKVRVEEGEVWVKSDGRVRWSYVAPQRKDFVFDGKTAYFYEPENAQVTVFEHFTQSPLAHAMEFVWGKGKLDALFTYAACDAQCATISPEEEAVRLTPKTPMAAVDHLVLVVDKKTAQVHRSVVADALGNTTEYAFTNLRPQPRIPEAKFQFTIPDGVSVLRASSGEP